MYVVGTAGHVDHGKSTLVHALTGIDPDRLREEKERGMTIDLGFAWLKLPSGQEISIVDVPGHERFIKNMLAGVGGIDVALLVVAADEGPMPQTDEHLAILDLLGIARGVVAITKADLVDEEWMELVKAEVEERLGPTSLAGAPMLPVSSTTGRGLQELLATLDRVLAAVPPKRDVGKARIPVDRVFTVPGFGTVITGTLIDGELRVGQEVELLPSGKKSRVRGIQSHKKKTDVARPGSRVAVNLASLATDEIRRGDVVTTPGWLWPTKALDVKLQVIGAAPKPLEHGDELTFHAGATESVAKLSLLDADRLEPGRSGWAQLRLADPVAVARGDQFIVRIPSPSFTVGGGMVVDPHPKRHRRFQAQLVESLSTLERGTPEEIVLQQMPPAAPMELQTVARRSGLSQDQVRQAASDLLAKGQLLLLDAAKGGTSDTPTLNAQSLLITTAAWSTLRQRIEDLLVAYHAEYPLRRGMPREEVRSRSGLDARAFSRVEAQLLSDGIVTEDGPLMARAGHDVRFDEDLQRRIDQFVAALKASEVSPPAVSELLARFHLDTEALAALTAQGLVVEVAPGIVLEKQVYTEMVQTIVEMIRMQGPITVAAVRDRFNTSRKYALAIMEHLDEKRITRRVGDERVLV
ncbi:MAG: selenocysteine-specific translation elongation factor [Sphingomonadaceae bacterium]